MTDKHKVDDIPRFTRPADIDRSGKGKLSDRLFDDNNQLRLTLADKLLHKLLKLLRISS
ncbi:MAG: hypothetical protein AB7U43_00675 [Desulfobacter sp.]